MVVLMFKKINVLSEKLRGEFLLAIVAETVVKQINNYFQPNKKILLSHKLASVSSLPASL